MKSEKLISFFLPFSLFLTIFAPMIVHAPLLPLAACLMVGIVMGGCLENWFLILPFLIVLAVIVCLLSRWPRWQTAGIWCCTVLLGMTLGARQQYQPHARPSVNEQALEARQHFLNHYRQWGLSEKSYGVVAAMTLGEKSHLDRELKDTYSRVGASHILALSGLHLMIIYAFISLFIAWRRFRMLSQVAVIIALWAFAFLVGMSPSVVRSACMISLYALLSLGHRQRMSVNTLALTAIIMLAVNPASLFDISFQLSFMAVLAILLFNPLFTRLIPLHVLQRHRWLKALWGMTTVSLSAQMGTAPLIAFYFGHFSTYFLLSNYVVVPLATAVLYLTLCCLLTTWWKALQHGLVIVLAAVVGLMNRLLTAISHLPFCTIEGLHPSIFQVVLLYVIIACGYVLFSLTVPKARQSA